MLIIGSYIAMSIRWQQDVLNVMLSPSRKCRYQIVSFNNNHIIAKHRPGGQVCLYVDIYSIRVQFLIFGIYSCRDPIALFMRMHIIML